MVTLTITGGPTITFPWVSGMNGQTALEAAFNAQPSPKAFTFNLQYYGTSLGYLVDMINGTFDTALSTDAPYFFWDFSVNGTESQYGIDNTPISNGDVIEFSYIMYVPETAQNKKLAAKYAAKFSLN